MRSRALALLALAASLAALPADAATRYCRLVKENPGDKDMHADTRGLTPFGPYDLKSMDVATNATQLTGVIRVADLTNTSPTAAVEGGTYKFYFSADREHHWILVAHVGADKDRFEIWKSGGEWVAPEDEGKGAAIKHIPPDEYLANVRGVVDPKANEIRLTVPLSLLDGRVVRGRKLDHLGGHSYSWKVPLDEHQPVTGPWLVGQFEDAVSARASLGYPAGAPSCVRVGR